ncbi:MAG: hypothetical protein L6R38_007959 [Xanthoria sp. 2 TBL-2021]|nr:MAG: hypothetical protein L6R38_007959 [Xanthoria sp. 2 TBL-2021]
MTDQRIPDTGHKRAHSVEDVSCSEGEVGHDYRLTSTCSQYHPQFDPREEECTDEQETSDTNSVDSVHDESDTDDPIVEVPPTIRELETNPAVPDMQQAVRPHDRYTRFLHHLCSETGTATRENDCLRYWPDVFSEVSTLDMSKSLADDQQFDLFAHAMLIYVWLLVCMKRGQGTVPDRDKYLHQQLASYYLSAREILEAEGTDTKQLASAVRYWEDRGKQKMDVRSRSHWLQQVKQDDLEVPCDRNEEAQGYLATLSNSGVEGLTRELIRLEVQLQQSAMKDLPDMEARRGMLIMLLSMDPELLTAIIEGQVARKAEIPNSAVSSCLLKLSGGDNLPPSIYQNSICDQEGHSPTPSQWLKIHDLMRIYVSTTRQGDELAATVDQIIFPSKFFPIPTTARQRRFRRYTDYDSKTGKKRFEPSAERRSIVLEFANEILHRLNEEEAAQRLHVPMVAPVVEIGFSDNVVRRLRDHRRHRRSNYIMNLAQALFEYRYPKQFCLKQHIIYHCFSPDQPWASEIFLTRLAQGYIANGGGFSHHGPGSSNGGAWRRRPEQDWARFMVKMDSDKGFQDRCRAVAQRAAERIAKQEAEAAEVAWTRQYLQAMDEMLDAITEMETARRNFMSQDDADA